MKNTIIGLKELRENVETYVNQVRKGKSFIVMRRSKPILKISSPNEEELWETVIDFTKIKKDGISAKDILKELRELNAQS